MNITIIGTGYVGLVSGACFSEFGFNVTCVDKDKNKIANLNSGLIPIYEPSLENLVKKNVLAKRLFFSTNLSEDFKNSDAIFIAVGTPTNLNNNKADLKYIFEVTKEVADLIELEDKPKLIVTKSTVPVGTGKKIESYMLNYRKELQLHKNFEVASNPEFLREGSAIEDFMRPDRVVCGVENKFAKSILEKLYRPLNLRETPIIFCGRETAELIKYASNGFLATKITFINEMADICEKVGADIQEVAKGIGLDGRIGSKFLHPGPGFGGSCFPKDTRALSEIAKEAGTNSRIIDSVIKVNESRKFNMVKKIKDTLSPLKNKSLSILGLTFKPNTDDMRESTSLIMLPYLNKKRAKVTYYDPSGEKNEFRKLKNVLFSNDLEEACLKADLIIIHTEWDEFKSIDFKKISRNKNLKIYDLRNLYSPAKMRKSGLSYYSIGR